MITISRNQNFKEWLNIKVFGVLVTNAKSNGRAMNVAYQIQHAHKQKTGERLSIMNKS